MAETLTREQRLAVEDRGGKLLVSAAAGSGKTKVLVDRLMGYMLDPRDPANIDDFLIITYTKAAASELRSKIAAKISELIAAGAHNRHLQKQMQRLYLAKISTVHGFCTDILRQYAYRLDITGDFRVAEEGECLELQLKAFDQVLNEAYDTADANPEFRAFVDSQGLGRDDRQIPEIILKVYNSARCHLNPDQWLSWCTGAEFSGVTDAGQTPWGKYLMEDFRQSLSMHIDAMNRCIGKASVCAGMEKPTALFTQTVSQLQALRDSATWDEIVEHGAVDFGRLTFPKNCPDLQLSEQMKAVRNACKEGLSKKLRTFSDLSSQIMTDMTDSIPAAKGLVALTRAFSQCYERLKKNRGILDFGDLEHYTLDLLLGKQRSGVTAVADEIGDRFREVMVDEYQDTNEIQDSIFAALTRKRNNCFMVGDVKQSIYQFRLADPGIFIEKYNAYAPAESAKSGEGRKVLLSHNFRSSGGVISAVNEVFTRCMSPEVGGLAYGESEMLREGIAHIPLQEPEVSLYAIDVNEDTYGEEASFVADKICALLDGTHFIKDKDKLRPVRPEDVVILLRSPGSVGAAFQYALHSRGLRCVTGDAGDLLQAEEIAAVRSILQVINNPLQDIPLAAALTSPVFGFTAEDLAAMRSRDRYGSLYSLLCDNHNEKCQRFMTILGELRQLARHCTVTQLLGHIYTKTHVLSAYSAMADGALRLENLQNFYQIVSDYEGTGPRELSRLIAYLDAAEERGLSAAGTQQDAGAVTIMSIHKSKGLEFPVVFLCGLSRGFNQESAREQVLCDKDLGLGLSCVDAGLRVRYPTLAKRAISAKILRDSVSEELRVLYVAMTRARDRLVMTCAVKNLPGYLREFATRLDMTAPRLLCAEASCPGDWVMQTAMGRTEAGALFSLGGYPDCVTVSDSPWHIASADGNISEASSDISEDTPTEISAPMLEKMSAGIEFTYANVSATQIPSKITATQLKGRPLDTEIAEGTGSGRIVDFRKPSLTDRQSGKARGSATHAVMQYIRFSSCDSEDNIRHEVDRMVKERLVAPEQAQLVDCGKLAAFFATPFGKKLQLAKNVLREFKFSLLDDAEKYYPQAEGEQVLLQGVVDCALIEEDGIIVLDFKTDYVTEDTLSAITDKYRAQVLTYAGALERIYEMPVKSAMLYFFALDRYVEMKM